MVIIFLHWRFLYRFPYLYHRPMLIFLLYTLRKETYLQFHLLHLLTFQLNQSHVKVFLFQDPLTKRWFVNHLIIKEICFLLRFLFKELWYSIRGVVKFLYFLIQSFQTVYCIYVLVRPYLWEIITILLPDYGIKYFVYLFFPRLFLIIPSFRKSIPSFSCYFISQVRYSGFQFLFTYYPIHT